ncbi:hypothetical protein IP84_14815 [beta proteobacterium AAP99]|nr:hypothetical protein IP84_14815 [beta proteobacterium AAP99]
MDANDSPDRPAALRAVMPGTAQTVRAVVPRCVLIGALVLLLSACSRAPEPPKAEIEALKANCVQAMVSSTCRVMQGQGVSLVPKDAQTVFVAGIGPIDASLYGSLREQGEGMCQHLADVCTKDWAGNPCQTARKLYATPG